MFSKDLLYEEGASITTLKVVLRHSLITYRLSMFLFFPNSGIFFEEKGDSVQTGQAYQSIDKSAQA